MAEMKLMLDKSSKITMEYMNAISLVSTSTEQQTASMQELASSANELSNIAQTLKDTVEAFKL
ncbi:hypothetical protein ACP26L_11100 [Paenibacillus sp. S-38]|uniref:hypothetical protein n=1 Tax=Paenibacillus sp. S-38 TaxID=3416710 RepID=UPI003CEC0E7B